MFEGESKISKINWIEFSWAENSGMPTDNKGEKEMTLSERMTLKWSNLRRDVDLKLVDEMKIIKKKCDVETFRESDLAVRELQEIEQSAVKCQMHQLDELKREWNTVIDDWKREIEVIEVEMKTDCISALKEHRKNLFNINIYQEDVIELIMSEIIEKFNQMFINNKREILKIENCLKLNGESIFNKALALLAAGEEEEQEEEPEADDKTGYETITSDDFTVGGESDLLTRTHIMDRFLAFKSYSDELFPLVPKYGQGVEVLVKHMGDCIMKMNDIKKTIFRNFETILKDDAQYKMTSDDECFEMLGVFEEQVTKIRKVIQKGTSVWISFICRLEEIKRIIREFLFDNRNKEEDQAMKTEMKLNILYDQIRQSPSKEELQKSVHSANQCLDTLEEMYKETWNFENTLVSEFPAKSVTALALFLSELKLLQEDDDFVNVSSMPEHGSEKSYEIQISAHDVFIAIKKNIEAMNNWKLGSVNNKWETIPNIRPLAFNYILFTNLKYVYGCILNK